VLDRHTADIEIAIYNLAGEFIKNLVYNSQWMNPTKFRDYYFLYTAEWDGNNEYGQSVATGIYFLVLRADRSQKIIKQAIIR
jgi:hypothetical protein